MTDRMTRARALYLAAGELDRQRDDLLQRHKATQRALALTNGEL